MSSRGRSSSRTTVFVLVVVVSTITAAIAVASAVRSSSPAAKPTAGARGVLPAAQAHRRPMVVFRTVDPRRPGAGGQVAIAALGATGRRRTLTPLTCDRVSYSATGVGICLARGRGFAADEQVKVFGPDLRVRHQVGVAGVPSRARVSPDGRLGAVTLFVAGHSYAAAGSFSTQTTILDLAHGRKIANLEDFVVLRGGRRVTAIDVNFWGVTFARDSDRFYATMATGGKTYLIRGSVRAREARVIHENVECPSLSPDGTRIAFKRRGRSESRPWRLTVLDLATGRETPLSETRSVDDQAEWLDDHRVLYGVDHDVWTARADGRGRPGRFLAGAGSPAAVRF
jgi:WD40-like Beta Propeller Repeat